MLEESDNFKISLSDKHACLFDALTYMFCVSGNPPEALYVAELRRARALADMLSWVGIEGIMENESGCVCLYISYSCRHVFFWILKTKGTALFRMVDVSTSSFDERSIQSLDKFLHNDIEFRKFTILPQESCEDRSLSCATFQQSPQDADEDPRVVRLLEEDKEEEGKEPEPSLSLYYQLIIAPVVDLLDEPEVIIVPERSLYHVPFAALRNGSGKYLSETFRIRFVPSLSTLRLIKDSPPDYHSETGALIVGDPDVGHVIYKGRLERKPALPCARKEAETIGQLIHAEPLLGENATKQAVLQRIRSVGVIHFAAHGDAERGEIALAPLRPSVEHPQEEDYLLTMSDISRVQLRAKLVVLSCCHSASGHVRAEGIIGIARAFLGSGARSVLVALWALEDSATEQLMTRFYEHLVQGKSASESLHQAMKWMRTNGYSNVRDWAPFMLIGDDVTFDFGK